MQDRLGPYRILSELGRGGMGVVLKGYDETLERPVAIKVLGEHVAGESSYVARFVREAQNAAKLNHPNIVQIYYIGEDHGRNFFVMEFVEGRSLQQILRSEGRFEPLRATELIRQAALGLAAAHDRGVIHRDIKPANLMLCSDGRIKIADFGLAVMPEGGARLTATGSILGTPGYLSPEQCMAEPLDRRTDVYSLGITFYEMLSGTMPFKADSPFALVHQVVTTVPPEVSQVNPKIAPEVSAILRKMIAKKREERYDDCHALLADIDGYLARGGGAAVGLGDRPTPVSLPSLDRRPAPAADAVSPNPFASPDSDETINLGAPTVPRPMPAARELPTPAAVPALVASAVLTPPPGQSLALRPETVPAAGAPAAKPALSSALLVAAVLAFLVVVGGMAAAGLWIVKKDPFHLQARASDSAAPETAAGTRAAPAGEVRTAATLPAAALPAAGAGTTAGAPGDATAAAAAGGSGTGATPPEDSAGGSVDPIPPTASDSTSGTTTTAARAPAATAAAATLAAGGAGGTTAAVASPDAYGGGSSTARMEGSARGASRKTAAAGAGAGAAGGTMAADASAPARQRLPLKPRILVLASGERLLADAALKHLQDALRGQGFEVPDLSNLPDIDDQLAAGASPLAGGALDVLLRARGIDVVVMARNEPLGERQLNYMGRSETASTARLRVNAFLAQRHDALGSGWSEKVEYTALTVDRKTETVIQGLSDDLVQAVRGGWDDYRRQLER